ncbi:MAG: HAMP domain-containing sensor histidine kinase, partial [Planctomycetota bacterium]|nr:HAMP domain-containing sensor histidine kinase [Planctomycetota bacterium]
YVITVLVVYGLLMALAVFLMAGIAEMLREGERRLRQANQELERLSSMRRAFLHIALHDLKGPVGAVSMLVDNMASGLGGSLSDKQAHWAARAKVRLHEVLTFLRDMQILAELDAAQVAAAAEPVDVGALLKALVDEHQDLAQQRRHTLCLELPAATDGAPRPGTTLGGLTARSVERLLREAVANYITNAIKYTPEGGRIAVRANLAQASGPQADGTAAPQVIRVEVADNGRGIAPDDQARLFGEFVRILPKDHGGPPVSGTGLGLSIVRRIAELHGGRAGVVSQPGQGSTFFLEIPAVR